MKNVIRHKAKKMVIANIYCEHLDVYHYSAVYNFYAAWIFENEISDSILANVAEDCEMNVNDLEIVDYEDALKDFEIAMANL